MFFGDQWYQGLISTGLNCPGVYDKASIRDSGLQSHIPSNNGSMDPAAYHKLGGIRSYRNAPRSLRGSGHSICDRCS